MRVAVVGVGRMGAAMARRIAAEGDHDLIVFNRGADRARDIAASIGAEAAQTAQAAAGAAEVVLVSLADDSAVLETYRSDHGILAGLRPGIVVCDTSTVAPATMRELAPEVSERGAALLDTPVSGSVPVVEQGQLTIMVGGDAEALAVAQPVLDLISKQTFHLGEVGAGSTMKLVVNSMVAALNSGVSEALVLAEKAGIDRAQTYDVLMSSAAGAPYVHYKQPAFLEPEAAAVAFSLALVAKDQRLIHELAEQVGASMPQADANRACVAAAVDAGWGEADMSALASYLRTLS